MLLLVLILVLIAFGLLVVALLTSSVLWAWVSVAVSVAAASALIGDWYQRRSAVPAATREDERVPYRPDPADLDPATEVLPAVRATGPLGAGAERGRSDDQDTVVFAAVQPSGSPDRPSGAPMDGTQSSDTRSPTVTDSEADRPSGSAGGAADGPAGEIPAEPRGAPEAHDTGDGAPGVPAGTPAAGAADTTITVVPVAGAGAAEPAAAHSPPAATGPSAPGTAASGGQRPEGAAAHDVPDRDAEARDAEARDAEARDAAAPDAKRAEAPVREEPPPSTADDEPPVEQADPAAAELVARLEDEVVVVDEQPRYHVTGCRSVLGQPIIPLPAREAVELGFTPCGWCSPDRTLSERHSADAR